MNGKLIYTDGNWKIYDYESETVLKTPIHNDHSLWLKLFGDENMEVCYQLNSIDNETYIVIKSCKEIVREYTQD